MVTDQDAVPEPSPTPRVSGRGRRGRFRTRRRAFGRQLRRRIGRTRAVLLRATRLVLTYAFVGALSLAAGLVVVALYAEYGNHPVRNAASWANQPVRYAVGTECSACHAGQVEAIAERSHARVDCQACHGPRADHARSADVALVVAQDPARSSPAACLVCHERVSGRPAAFPMVVAAAHFGPAPCLLCHDPHTARSEAPPRVLHSLDRLPDCLVCHGSDGLRPMPARHPAWPEGDCLICHLRPDTSAP